MKLHDGHRQTINNTQFFRSPFDGCQEPMPHLIDEGPQVASAPVEAGLTRQYRKHKGGWLNSDSSWVSRTHPLQAAINIIAIIVNPRNNGTIFQKYVILLPLWHIQQIYAYTSSNS